MSAIIEFVKNFIYLTRNEMFIQKLGTAATAVGLAAAAVMAVIEMVKNMAPPGVTP